jgi:hypothetical protein
MGIINAIKKVFSSGNEVVNSDLFNEVINNSRKEYAKTDNYFWNIKLNRVSVYNDTVLKWSDKDKIAFIIYCMNAINRFWDKEYNNRSSNNVEYNNHSIREAYVIQLFRAKIHIDDEDLENIVNTIPVNKSSYQTIISRWPLGQILTQIERQQKEKEVSDKMIKSLTNLKNQINSIKDTYQDKDKIKLTEKIDGILFKNTNEGEIKPTRFLGQDAFSSYANDVIDKLPDNERKIWFQLIAKAQKATGSKPSKKYLDDTKVLFKELGTDKFKQIVNDWFVFLTGLKEVSTEYRTSYGIYTSEELLSAINIEAIKGFIWMCAHFHDTSTLFNLAQLADRCYKKIPGKGPAAAAVGNACMFTLYKSKGLEGIGHLSRLKLKIKQASTQQIIDNYIKAAAEEQGVSTDEIEDMAVEQYKLVNGTREFQFDDYTCILKITGAGKSELLWYKPDGEQQKSVPGFVKDKHAAKLKKLKETQKQVDQTTSAQRDRLDRIFKTDRQMNYPDFKKFYLDHGLMSFLSRNLIWVFKNNATVVNAIMTDTGWVSHNNQPVTIDENSKVSLWHPACQTVEEVRNWRNYMVEHQIVQPLKQAYREVYLVTAAEANTKSYSNRMAAHVLKQHQFNMLAKIRGWKYTLMGAFDNGADCMAKISLPDFGLRAEYWLNEVSAENAYTDSGIWNYITTDQIRFVNTTTNETVDMVDIPVLPFSEILRDVDLFVGVASVGNDPTWQDSGGMPAFRDYWQSYSFGDLSEVAKNRKEILTGLIPRLKIGKVSEIKDKFLVVKGKLRTYKIHIGSTNILMEPNDQYLCIVPDRSQKNHTENIFIPFEGDSGLSIILSKAFLLADDDKITDSTITSQIGKK